MSYSVTFQDVKDRLSIRQVVGSVVELDRYGRGLCPFHNDTRPSLSVCEKRQRFRCWSCGASGDVYDLLEKYYNITTGQAFKMAANLAGFDVNQTMTPQLRQQIQRERREREEAKERIMVFNEWCSDWAYYVGRAVRACEDEAKELQPGQEPDDLTAFCIRNKEKYEYWENTLRWGSPEDKLSLYFQKCEEWGKIWKKKN